MDYSIKNFEDVKNTFLYKIIYSKELFEKIGAERLEEFFRKYVSDYSNLDMYYNARSSAHPNPHIMPNRYKNTQFQKDFRKLVGDVFGEHAYRILEERPNLNIKVIPNFRIFDKGLYDSFGENFIHQLLNFNYARVANGIHEFNDLLEDVTNNEDSLHAFRYCLDFIKNGKQTNIYDYTKLFRTYSRYSDLFKDCYKHRDTLTKEQLHTLGDVITCRYEEIEVKSVSDLNQYPKMVNDLFQHIDDTKSTNEIIIAFYERFFGLDISSDSKMYRRSTNKINDMLNFYNIERLIAYEENISKFGKQNNLTKQEVSILKILVACEKIRKCSGKMNSYDVKEYQRQLVLKLYRTFEEATMKGGNSILTPYDFRKLFDKIPEIYEKSLKKTLTSVTDLEKAVEKGRPGVTKEFMKVEFNGSVYNVPVYHLKGMKFSCLTTATEADLSIDNKYESGDPINKAAQWFEYEKGVTHISCSYVTSAVRAGIEFGFSYRSNDSINYIINRDSKLISMGNDDIFSSSEEGNPDSYSKRQTAFYMPFDLAFKSRFNEFNEVTVERYSPKTSAKGSTIIPEALFKKGKEPTITILEHACQMTEYLVQNGLAPKGYVFPVVMCDETMYLEHRTKKELDTIEKKSRYLDDLSYSADDGAEVGNSVNDIQEYIESLKHSKVNSGNDLNNEPTSEVENAESSSKNEEVLQEVIDEVESGINTDASSSDSVM